MIIQKNKNEKHYTILLVEDNPAHAEMVLREFENIPGQFTLFHVEDGEEALDFLFQRGTFADPQKAPRPHLILLDLRLPKIGGLEVLGEIKNNDSLLNIPVVVLTTSDADRDVATAYKYHANSYLVKPFDFDEFSKMMGVMASYWLTWNNGPI